MLPGIEYIKTLLNGIMSRLRRVEKDVAETKTKAVNSDWNVHDTGDGAHIKNRPFYNDYVESMLLYRVNDPPQSGQGAAYLGVFESAFLVGKTYRVTLDGAGVNNGTYECKCTFGDGNNGTTVGRLYLLKSVGSHAINDGSIFQNPDTLEVFAWSWWDDAKYTLTIEGPGYELKPIDPKYLSWIDSDFLGDKAVTSIDGKTGALSSNDIAVTPVTVKGLATYSGEGIRQRVCYENASAVYLGNEVFLTTSDYVGYGKNRAIFPCHNVASKTSNAYFAHRMPDSQNCSALCLTNVGYIKSYAVPIPPTASVGQTIAVKAVDGNGKPTEWEASDMVTVDTTLTQSGQAADAAAVGNRISALSEDITSQVATHNTGTDTHSDIRLLIQGLTDRLNALADSDDTTLDQLSEVVAYIKSNRGLIEAITTSKVSVSDIIDNLTTNVANKPLSAAQGVALKALIDGIVIPDKLPNPNALTFTGAVTGSYDGSEAKTINIPTVDDVIAALPTWEGGSY